MFDCVTFPLHDKDEQDHGGLTDYDELRTLFSQAFFSLR